MFFLDTLRDHRRRKMLAEPFPPHWDAVLKRNVAHYPHLTAPQAAKMRDTVRILHAEKTWEGCGGLHITDEIKLTVSAQASLLVLGHSGWDAFARIPSIIVYPDQFRTPNRDDGYEDDGLSEEQLDGQAVYRGPVILGWKSVMEEGRDPSCGFNVVIHEFAHQLDFLDGDLNGTPPLESRAAEERWGKAMTAAYQRHCKELDAGADTFFTEHAADDEGEFFADAAEAFYCRPHDLFDEEREVFEVLQSYFKVEPREWFPGRV